MNHNFGIRMILFFAMIAWSCIAVSALDETKETETLTLRTIAYHEITALTDDISSHNGAMPVISDNGESATFIAYPDGKAHLYVVKTDGTKPPRDVYSFDHNMDAPVAISPDGTKAATGNGFQIGLIPTGMVPEFRLYETICKNAFCREDNFFFLITQKAFLSSRLL